MDTQIFALILIVILQVFVESQKDFHTKRSAEGVITITSTVASTAVTAITWRPGPGPLPNITAGGGRVTPMSLPTATTFHVPVVVPQSTEHPPTPSTTPTTTTTTIPPRFCVVQRQHQTNQYIREGRGKRLYNEDEPECSEMCQCNEGETLICNTVCVERLPCKTDFAFYNHKAPAYQAYRGRCLCYSGRFICMRPVQDAYHLPQGIFLFLGYSETDETLLKPHSNLTVRDAVISLEDFMRNDLSNKTSCSLSLYNVTKENLILVAKLPRENQTSLSREARQRSALDQLTREKDECVGPLQEISDKINSHHPELHSHPLLSIFKMAEVEIKVPESSSTSTLRPTLTPCGLALVLLLCLPAS